MWNDIKTGQILLTKNRKVTIGRRVIFTEWKEHIVESVSKIFYVVNGEKYRKEACGKNFMYNFYFPGVDGAPDKATDPEQYDSTMDKVKLILSLGTIVRPDLDCIADLDKAAELAAKLQGVLTEIKAQPKI